MSKTSLTSITALEQKALSGIDKRLSNVASLTLGGIPFTPADLKKVLSDDLVARSNTTAAKAALRVAVVQQKGTGAKARALLKRLKAWLIVQSGNDVAAVLQDFGFQEPKTPKPTVKVKASAADKALATRKARHTLGKKQKADITGATPNGAVPANPPAASK